MAESQSAAAVMAGLINKGKANEAFEYAIGDKPTPDDKADANFWFMSALAARQFAGDTGVVRMRHDMAKQCGNYSRQMEGDFHRDGAIALLKSGNTQAAMSELRNAYDIHIKDKDRLRVAADDMVRGRILFAKKDYHSALLWHNGTEQDFKKILSQEPDNETARQWRLNNSYHRLRTIAMLEGFSFDISNENYAYVIAHSQDRRQRIGARFAWYGRRPGVRLFDRFVESRLSR